MYRICCVIVIMIFYILNNLRKIILNSFTIYILFIDYCNKLQKFFRIMFPIEIKFTFKMEEKYFL